MFPKDISHNNFLENLVLFYSGISNEFNNSFYSQNSEKNFTLHGHPKRSNVYRLE